MKLNTLKHCGIIISLLLTIVLTSLPARADLGEPDVSTMFTLRNTYGWALAFGWSTSNPCPTVGINWGGVTCQNGRVVAIAVSCGANKLTTPFPTAEINSLTGLNTFRFQSCYISPGRPAAEFSLFDQKTNLTRINLNAAIIGDQDINGNFSEIFPNGVSPARFPNLVEFSFSATGISGQISDGIFAYSDSIIIRLNVNRFTGTLPATGNSSKNILLHGNALEGVIPNWLVNATGTVRVRYNKFDVVNTPAGNLDNLDPGWRDTQTVPPTNVQVVSGGTGSAILTWTPITYQAHGGYYEILSSQTPGGPYTSRGTTAATGGKTANGLTVTGLQAAELFRRPHFHTGSYK